MNLSPRALLSCYELYFYLFHYLTKYFNLNKIKINHFILSSKNSKFSGASKYVFKIKIGVFIKLRDGSCQCYFKLNKKFYQF